MNLNRVFLVQVRTSNHHIWLLPFHPLRYAQFLTRLQVIRQVEIQINIRHTDQRSIPNMKVNFTLMYDPLLPLRMVLEHNLLFFDIQDTLRDLEGNPSESDDITFLETVTSLRHILHNQPQMIINNVFTVFL